MISERQLEANRRNAQRSTGPRTEEGKKASALNARRHNLTGQVTAMTDADRIMHDAFSASIVENLAPEGAMETQLAQRIATDSWRLNRISAVEDNLFALGHNAKADDTKLKTRKSTQPSQPPKSSRTNQNNSSFSLSTSSASTATSRRTWRYSRPCKPRVSQSGKPK